MSTAAYNPISSDAAAATASAAATRATSLGGLSSPWNHVVRGDTEAIPTLSISSSPPSLEIAEPSLPSCPSADSTPATPSIDPLAPSLPPEPTEIGSGGNAAGKRPAWNVPNNGASDGGAVMGADSWPALCESTKGFPKSVSSEPSRILPNGSASVSVEAMIGNTRPKISTSSPNPSSSSSSAFPARQKPNLKFNPNKRNNCGNSIGSPTNGAPGSPQQSPTSLETAVVGLAVLDPSPKDPTKGSNTHWDNNRGVATQQHGGGDCRAGYSRNRRGNNGGGGFHRERGGQDWNAPRFFCNRGARMSMPLCLQRGYARPFAQPPPPPPAPFFAMPPPFVGPAGFPEVHPIYYVPPPPPLDPLRSMSYVPHQVPPALAPAVVILPVDPNRPILLKQIEYYFSSENLRTDAYLKEQMDDQGWVPISLIAGFNRVKKITSDISYILDILRGSAVVEIQGDKIRPRNDWMKWARHPMSKPGVASTPRSPTASGRASLTIKMQNLKVDDNAFRHKNFGSRSQAEIVASKPACGNLNDLMPNGDLVETKPRKFQSPQNQIALNLQNS